MDSKKRIKTNSNDTKIKPPKIEICEKFKKNPQSFFTENLCDLVIKSLDLEENGENDENKKNEEKEKINLIDKKINMQAYYNLKKYFEENNLDDD